MSDLTISRGPGNEPTKCVQISKASLLRKLTPGTLLTLVHTDFRGPCRKHRKIIKATTSQIALEQIDDGRTEPSYLRFNAGDKIFEHEDGFTIKTADNLGCSYIFGCV